MKKLTRKETIEPIYDETGIIGYLPIIILVDEKGEEYLDEQACAKLDAEKRRLLEAKQ